MFEIDVNGVGCHLHPPHSPKQSKNKYGKRFTCILRVFLLIYPGLEGALAIGKTPSPLDCNEVREITTSARKIR